MRRMLSVSLVAACAAGVPAGLIRHDRDDSAYQDLAADPRLGFLGELGSMSGGSWGSNAGCGSYIGGRWVLSAAHVNASAFRINGDIIRIARTVRPSGWSSYRGTDIALVELEREPTGVVPGKLSFDMPAQRDLITTAGYGRGGDGISGVLGSSGNVRRAGTNVIDVFGTLQGPDGRAVDERVFFCDFDAPDGQSNALGSLGSAAFPTEMELQPATYDSGGPALVERGGELRIAGVVIFGSAGNGEGGYGSVSGGTVVARHLDWIRTAGGFCPADFDLDGAVNVQDLLAYLGAYRNGSVSADMNGSVTLAVDDLLAFLGRYRAGCP